MTTAAKPAAPTVRLRTRITVGDEIAIGPGKVELLEAVSREGSISAAARSIGMSYRRAWLLIDELNRALREPATETAQGGENGGGARLTRVGEEVVRRYRQAETDALKAGAPQMRRLLSLLR